MYYESIEEIVKVLGLEESSQETQQGVLIKLMSQATQEYLAFVADTLDESQLDEVNSKLKNSQDLETVLVKIQELKPESTNLYRKILKAKVDNMAEVMNKLG